MNIRIKPIKKRYAIYAALIAVFSTLFCSLSLVEIKLDPKKCETGAEYFFRVLLKNMGRNSTRITYQLIAIVVFLLFLILFSYKFNKRQIISSAILGVLFGLSMWIGKVYAKGETWEYCFKDASTVTMSIFYGIGYAVIAMGIFLAIAKVAIWYDRQEGSKGEAAKWSAKKVWVCCIVAIAVCWLPYYIIYWPGILHIDFIMQVFQLFHIPTRFQGEWVTNGTSIVYSNDHPFFYIQLVGIFLKLGVKLKHVALAYGIYTFLQMAVHIVVVSTAITLLYITNVKHIFLKIAIAFYALCPIFPLYAIFVGADSLFGVFFFLFGMSILCIIRTRGNILKSKFFFIGSMINTFLLCIAKSHGFYIALVMAVILAIYCKNYRKQAIILLIVPILFCQFGYMGLVFRVAHVQKVGTQEAVAVCFYQTARYVKYHGDEVTEGEKYVINRVLDYDTLAKNYRQGLVDPVKATYKREATSKDLKNYFIVWAKMGLKHPDEYVQSFLASTYGYYYPVQSNNKRLKMRGLYTESATVEQFLKKRSMWYTMELLPEDFAQNFPYKSVEQMQAAVDTLTENVSYEPPKQLENAVKVLTLLIKTMQKNAVTNWLLTPGILAWFMFAAFFVLWIRKKYAIMVAFLPMFLLWGVCLLSPQNYSLRYMYPIAYLLPFMIATTFGGFQVARKKKEQENAKQKPHMSSAMTQRVRKFRSFEK